MRIKILVKSSLCDLNLFLFIIAYACVIIPRFISIHIQALGFTGPTIGIRAVYNICSKICSYKFRNRFFRYLKNQKKKKKKKKSLYNHPDLMAILMLKDSHYENPQSLLDECLVVLDLKDLDLRQKQRDIEALKKKVADLEEKLTEKDVQKKCFSCINVQTEKTNNATVADDASVTDEASATDVSSTTDDTIKSSTDKASDAPQRLKVKPKQKVSNKYVFNPSSVPKTPSVPKSSSKQTNFSAEGFRSLVCPWFIRPFMSKSKCSKKKQKTKTKKVWVEKKASPELRKMKQVWVIKGTSLQSEVLKTKEVREMIWYQKSKGKRRRVQKSEDGVCSSTDQRCI